MRNKLDFEISVEHLSGNIVFVSLSGVIPKAATTGALPTSPPPSEKEEEEKETDLFRYFSSLISPVSPNNCWVQFSSPALPPRSSLLPPSADRRTSEIVNCAGANVSLVSLASNCSIALREEEEDEGKKKNLVTSTPLPQQQGHKKKQKDAEKYDYFLFF